MAAASIDTKNARRDKHLRAADFFDSDTHPVITFDVQGVHPSGPGGRVTGTLPVRDCYAGPWNRVTAGTILLIGNTGDPDTPYQSSVALAHELARARLLTVAGYGHTEAGNPSSCADAYELRYALNGTLPARGTVCQQSIVPFPAAPGH